MWCFRDPQSTAAGVCGLFLGFCYLTGLQLNGPLHIVKDIAGWYLALWLVVLALNGFYYALCAGINLIGKLASRPHPSTRRFITFRIVLGIALSVLHYVAFQTMSPALFVLMGALDVWCLLSIGLGFYLGRLYPEEYEHE